MFLLRLRFVMWPPALESSGGVSWILHRSQLWCSRSIGFYTDLSYGAVGLLDFTQTDSGYWGPRVMFFEMLASCPASSLLALSSKNKGMFNFH